jgi:hypothetical protein
MAGDRKKLFHLSEYDEAFLKVQYVLQSKAGDLNPGDWSKGAPPKSLVFLTILRVWSDS